MDGEGGLVANWRKTVNVTEALDHDNDLTLTQRAAKIRGAFERSGLIDADRTGDLRRRLDDLYEGAATGWVGAFDEGLAGVYDWCDDNLVWMESMRPETA